MNHLDLFSGIGGFALAAKWVWGDEHHIHSFVEIEPFCQNVLKKHWPDVPIHSDIRTYEHDGTAIDLLTGGFPCQPFSCAGKQRGSNDNCFLWPAMLETIRDVQPTWIIGENVAGIINMGFKEMLVELEGCEYRTQTFLIPACGLDAPHKRNRIWIIANSNRKRVARNVGNKIDRCNRGDEIFKEWENRKSKTDWIKTATRICGINDGLPGRMDRLKSLGNAIVPQVVVPIMQAIKEVDEQNSIL